MTKDTIITLLFAYGLLITTATLSLTYYIINYCFSKANDFRKTINEIRHKSLNLSDTIDMLCLDAKSCYNYLDALKAQMKKELNIDDSITSIERIDNNV